MLKEGIYVDGCCNKSIGSVATVIEYKNGSTYDLIGSYHQYFPDNDVREVEYFNRLITNTKMTIKTFNVCFTDVVQQQNNGAELLAMTTALRIALMMNYNGKIYSDSQLIVNYWSKGSYNKINDQMKLNMIQQCTELRKQFEVLGGRIVKIDGDDNIADLGYHRKK